MAERVDRVPRASDDELAAALLVLELEGPAALTREHVARRLGRKRAGPGALPWPSERWLRSDLAALGFRRLRAAIDVALDALPADADDPVDRIFAAGRAYVRTAVRSPALSTLMHEGDGADFSHPELARDATTAFEQLRGLVSAVQATGFEADRDTDELSDLVWDSVHRLAVRWAESSLDGDVDAELVEEAIDLEMTLLLGDAPRRAAEAGKPEPARSRETETPR
jgi:hypothetical protein